ncbi:MAG: NUDIX hydrolase, partial [Acidobacteriota bacterium]
MKFCSECGGPTTVKVPRGDSYERDVCERCNRIFYRNPRIVVGTLPRWKGQILLCRRAIEPRYGFWTLPSGFMENGESVEEGALRETREEARAEVSIVRLFSVFSLPHVNQVYLTFLADLKTPEFGAGAESLEVRLFQPSEIPWT